MVAELVTLQSALHAAAHGFARGAHWLLWWGNQLITSIEGKVDRNDLKTVATKLGPRLLTLGVAGKGADVAGAHETLASIARETLVQEDVFIAAAALAGAILWSCIEVIGRRASGPTPGPVPQPLETNS